ncbi:hypothetical protein ACWKWU_21070 [Chitinophaga lutea]
MKLHALFPVACALLLSHTASGQRILRNLSFEYIATDGGVPSWEFGNSKRQYQINIDTTQAHTGACSMLVEPLRDAEADRGKAGGFSTVMGDGLFARRKVRISAYIKTENLAGGEALLGLELHGEQGSIAQAGSKSPQGTTEWTKYTVELPLTINVERIAFGFQMTGTGKAWFDNFEVLLDDQPITESIKLPPPGR